MRVLLFYSGTRCGRESDLARPPFARNVQLPLHARSDAGFPHKTGEPRCHYFLSVVGVFPIFVRYSMTPLRFKRMSVLARTTFLLLWLLWYCTFFACSVVPLNCICLRKRRTNDSKLSFFLRLTSIM